ncbi:hypothetical protein D3C75_779690 [compost metagenome]
MLLGFGNDLAEHQIPLAVGEAVGLGPGLDLGVETGVGPQMMAMGGEMQPLGIQTQGAREEGLVAHPATLPGSTQGPTEKRRVCRCKPASSFSDSLRSSSERPRRERSAARQRP